MKTLISAAALCFCGPAFATDWPAGGDEIDIHGRRCVIVQSLRAAYPNWVLNPDPFSAFSPQYYPVYAWSCPDDPTPPRLIHRPARRPAS